MKKNISIRIKATFLLMTFSFSMIAGFACSAGINMGYNKHHHENEPMAGSSSGHHDEMNHHQDSKDSKDDCCKGKVTEFNQMAKSLSDAYSADINPLIFTSMISLFQQVNIFSFYSEKTAIKFFVRSSPPTIPDIRTAIQSFLI